MDKIEWYIFVLAAILIAAVYYTGVKTDVKAFQDATTSIINSVTGRDPSGGQFRVARQ